MHFDQENIFGPTLFFQKSKNVTFLHLLQANLMQKIRKNNGGKYDNFCYGRTNGWTDGD